MHLRNKGLLWSQFAAELLVTDPTHRAGTSIQDEVAVAENLGTILRSRSGARGVAGPRTACWELTGDATRLTPLRLGAVGAVVVVVGGGDL